MKVFILNNYKINCLIFENGLRYLIILTILKIRDHFDHF